MSLMVSTFISEIKAFPLRIPAASVVWTDAVFMGIINEWLELAASGEPYQVIDSVNTVLNTPGVVLPAGLITLEECYIANTPKMTRMTQADHVASLASGITGKPRRFLETGAWLTAEDTKNFQVKFDPVPDGVYVVNIVFKGKQAKVTATTEKIYLADDHINAGKAYVCAQYFGALENETQFKKYNQKWGDLWTVAKENDARRKNRSFIRTETSNVRSENLIEGR